MLVVWAEMTGNSTHRSLSMPMRSSAVTPNSASTASNMTAGLFLGWEWLVAAGLAPLLVAVLPCAAMCALGLCANRMGNKGPSAETATGAIPPKEAQPPAPETVASTEASAGEKGSTPAPGGSAPMIRAR